MSSKFSWKLMALLPKGKHTYLFRFLCLKKVSRAEGNSWWSDVPYWRGKSALKTDRGLRSRCDVAQYINFFEHEVSYLYNEGRYGKWGASEARFPCLAHNSKRKCVTGNLYKNQWVTEETVPSGQIRLLSGLVASIISWKNTPLEGKKNTPWALEIGADKTLPGMDVLGPQCCWGGVILSASASCLGAKIWQPWRLLKLSPFLRKPRHDCTPLRLATLLCLDHPTMFCGI